MNLFWKYSCSSGEITGIALKAFGWSRVKLRVWQPAISVSISGVSEQLGSRRHLQGHFLWHFRTKMSVKGHGHLVRLQCVSVTAKIQRRHRRCGEMKQLDLSQMAETNWPSWKLNSCVFSSFPVPILIWALLTCLFQYLLESFFSRWSEQTCCDIQQVVRLTVH